MRASIEAVSNTLREWLPAEVVWLATLCRRTLEYVLGPLIDTGGRFPVWGLMSALVITAIVYLVDRSRRRVEPGQGFLAYCFPRSIVFNPSTLVDLKVGFFNSVVIGNALNLTWRINGAFIAAGVTGLLTLAFGPGPQNAAWSPLAVILLTLALSLANDLGYFFFHRASHVFAPLWAIHKLHHSAEVLSPLTAARVHPLEAAILGPFRAVTTGLLLGPILYLYAGEATPATVLGLELSAFLFNSLGHVLHHSHIRAHFGPVIGRVIVSPLQHQVHHSSLPQHLDRNFAEHWSIWDTLFGTLYMPRRDEPLKFGLAGQAEQAHPNLRTAYLRPVTESAAASLALLQRWLPVRASRRRAEVRRSAFAVEDDPGGGQRASHPPGSRRL
jgi:sterol desaturase/sphingolipid hydroxylase (fatty acid hydroxylase superfamily)